MKLAQIKQTENAIRHLACIRICEQILSMKPEQFVLMEGCYIHIGMLAFEPATLQTVFMKPKGFTSTDLKDVQFTAVIQDASESWYNTTA
jgi:hypothetical protein